MSVTPWIASLVTQPTARLSLMVLKVLFVTLTEHRATIIHFEKRLQTAPPLIDFGHATRK